MSSRELHVCIVSKYFYPRDTRLKQQVDALLGRDARVDVVCLRSPGQAKTEISGSLRIHRVSRPHPKDNFFLYLVATFIFAFRAWRKVFLISLGDCPDVTVAHTIPEFLVFVAMVPKLLRKVVVLDARDLTVELLDSRWPARRAFRSVVHPFFRVMENAACGFSDKVITASQGFQRRLVDRAVPSAKIVTIVNSADDTIFKFRGHHDLDVIRTGATLMYHGTVAERFGILVAVQALHLLQRQVPGSQLHVYGTYDPLYKQRIRRTIESLDLGSSVFLHGSRPLNWLYDAMKNVDIGIVPYLSTDFMNLALSTKTFEFAAAGVPVVASSLTSIRLVFNDGSVSFAEPGNPQDFADKIADLCSNPAERARRVEAARGDYEKSSGRTCAQCFWTLIHSAALRNEVPGIAGTGIAVQPRARRLADILKNDSSLSTTLKLYYHVKKLIPRTIQIFSRRRLARLQRMFTCSIWPIDHRAAAIPPGFKGWPRQRKFALVLRHDVESFMGTQKCCHILSLERAFGMRSAFFFVPEDYHTNAALRKTISDAGCEVGLHGLKHDGRLYVSRRMFRDYAVRINEHLKEWNIVGFASPSTHRRFDWLNKLDILYDSSSFDSDPFEPQPNGVRTIFPMLISTQPGSKAFVELPYTMPQDFTLFVILQEENIRIWRRKLDWVAARGGMVMVNTHPDYMRFLGNDHGKFTYPGRLYEDLLSYVERKYRGEYWSALPREVAEFWLTQSNDAPHACGDQGSGMKSSFSAGTGIGPARG